MASYSRVVAGLTILARYEPNGMEADLAAEHDEIFASGVEPDKISQEDRDRLRELGWRWDKNVDSWVMYA